MARNGPKKVTYISNIVVPGITSLIKSAKGLKGPLSANFGGAIFYSGLDLLSGISDRIKESKFTRLSKLVGTIGYSGKAVLDVYRIANQDYEAIVDFILDIPMAYQLGKDTCENYKGNDLLDDLGL